MNRKSFLIYIYIYKVGSIMMTSYLDHFWKGFFFTTYVPPPLIYCYCTFIISFTWLTFGHTQCNHREERNEKLRFFFFVPITVATDVLLFLLFNRNRFQLFSASACQCNDNQSKNKVRIINNTSPGHEICKCALHAHHVIYTQTHSRERERERRRII